MKGVALFTGMPKTGTSTSPAGVSSLAIPTFFLRCSMSFMFLALRLGSTFFCQIHFPAGEQGAPLDAQIRNSSSSLLNPELHRLQQGRVIKSDGFGSGNRHLGGTWSLVSNPVSPQR